MWAQLQQEQDERWATVSRATQLDSRWRIEQRGKGDAHRGRRLRLRAAVWLIRAGLRMADPEASA